MTCFPILEISRDVRRQHIHEKIISTSISMSIYVRAAMLYTRYNFIRSITLIQDMARVVIRAKRAGGSIMVRLPMEAVRQEDIHEGEMVEVEVKKARKSGFGLFPGMGSMTKED